MELILPPGASPLDPDYLAELIPDLSTQSELNEFEQINIIAAVRWASRSRKLRAGLLSSEGLRELHRHMFDQTWRWAGQYRKSDTNIGVAWYHVPVQVAALCDDTRYQIDHNVYPWDELAVRFHHRLVAIHPFPNGNGRHARMASDLLLQYHGRPLLTWGAGRSLVEDGDVRRSYLTALRQADKGDYGDLLEFARS